MLIIKRLDAEAGIDRSLTYTYMECFVLSHYVPPIPHRPFNFSSGNAVRVISFLLRRGDRNRWPKKGSVMTLLTSCSGSV